MDDGPLILSNQNTVHALREDGKTACGRTLEGTYGDVFTSDRMDRCWTCVMTGMLAVIRPKVVRKCTECDQEVNDYGWRSHEHYEPADPDEDD